MNKSPEQRFWDKVGDHSDPAVCWLWTGARTNLKKKHGDPGQYGVLRINYRNVFAHRLSYEMHYHTTIPEGMTIDHVKARGCTSTLCVNPYHLEVVTMRVNVLRGDGPSALAAKQTACIHGHLFDEENTYWSPKGYRCCRTCRRKRDMCQARKEARAEYQQKKGGCMDYDIEVNVGAQAYGRLTSKGIKDAIKKGESVPVEEKTEPLFSLQIQTDPKTLQPSYVVIYSPGAGAPISLSCVEFELLMRMYERGRNKLVAAVGPKKDKSVEPKVVEAAPGPFEALEEVP